MSRVGKKPVSLTKGVTATVQGQSVEVKGAKGTLSFVVPDDCDVALNDNEIAVSPRSESKRAQALWGMSRAMINNLVVGVSAGSEKRLEIMGVGRSTAGLCEGFLEGASLIHGGGGDHAAGVGNGFEAGEFSGGRRCHVELDRLWVEGVGCGPGDSTWGRDGWRGLGGGDDGRTKRGRG